MDAKEIADHAAKGGMLGISKESWMAALEKENYLKAAEMSMEDDYGMIDGIINNGPKEDKTAEVKAPERGEKSSIMDRLKSAKAEKQKECCPPKKHKGEIELCAEVRNGDRSGRSSSGTADAGSITASASAASIAASRAFVRISSPVRTSPGRGRRVDN